MSDLVLKSKILDFRTITFLKDRRNCGDHTVWPFFILQARLRKFKKPAWGRAATGLDSASFTRGHPCCVSVAWACPYSLRVFPWLMWAVWCGLPYRDSLHVRGGRSPSGWRTVSWAPARGSLLSPTGLSASGVPSAVPSAFIFFTFPVSPLP